MRYADIVLPLAQPTYSFAIADGPEKNSQVSE